MPKKILLVEDQAILAMATAKLLEKNGFTVIVERKGEDAVERVKGEPDISLILMDIDLGSGIDGTEAAQEILKNRELPIVFLTSHSEKEYVDKVKKITGYGYVLKNSGEFVLLESLHMAYTLFESHLESKRHKELLDDTGKLAKVGGWEFTIDTMKQRWTEETYRIHELSPDTVPDVELGLSFFTSEAKPVIEAAVHEAIEHGTPYDLQLPIITAKGNRRWVHTIGRAYYNEGRVYKVGGSIQDITELKEAKKNIDDYRKYLEEERDKFFTLTEISPISIVQLDRSGNIKYANKEAEKTLRLHKSELESRTYNDPQWKIGDFEGRPFPEDELPFLRVQKTGKPVYDVRHAVQFSDGSKVLLSINATPLYNEQEEFNGMIATLQEIDQGDTSLKLKSPIEKNTEKRASKSIESHYRNVLQFIPIFVLDRAFRYVQVNDLAAELVHMKVENLVGRKLVDIFPGIEATGFFAVYREVMSDRQPQSIEAFFTLPGGETGFYRCRVLPCPEGIQCICFDITELKNAVAAIKESEERFKTAMEVVNEGIWDWRIDTDEVYFSSGYYSMLGYADNEFPASFENFKNLVHPDDLRGTLEFIDKILKRGKQYDCVFRLRSKEDQWVWVHSKGRAVEFDDEGNPTRLIGTHTDITEQKRLEEGLRQEYEKFARVIQEANDGIVLTDEDGLIIEWNRAQEEITGLLKEEVLKRPLCEVQFESAPPEKKKHEIIDAFLKELKHFYKTGEAGWLSQSTESKMIRKDGREIFIETKTFVIPTDQGYRAGSIIRDVTKRKNEHRRLERLLEERQILLKEMNHRVKNNLYLINSLIGLKEHDLKGSIDLSDLKKQIHSIRLVHEQLHQSDTVTHIHFKDYAEKILSNVFSASSRSIEVKVTSEVDRLHSRITVPLGLIINELATNAVKYGFNDAQDALFSLELKRNGNEERGGTVQEYTLSVSNTGNPFPDNLDVERPQSMGLRLVSALADQLDGRLEIEREPYTVFTIHFLERRRE